MSTPTQAQSRDMTENAIKTASWSEKSDNIQAEILSQLRALNEITIANTLMANDSEARLQALWNTILQVLGVTFAVTFGVFAILAWNAALTANGLSSDANGYAGTANDLAKAADLMAMVQYCQAQPSNNNDNGALCSAIQSAASSSVSAYAASLYGIYPGEPPAATTTSTPGAPSGSSSHSGSVGKIVGIVVGAVVAASIFAVVQYHFYNYRRKRIGSIKRKAGIFSKSQPEFSDVQ